MQTYNRSGVQIEQCSGCRGIFLDYGELEALSRVESQWQQVPPPAPGGPAPYPAAPAWGAPHHGHHGHHGHRSFGHMLFSS
jgi:Zn-finger nucleic acid-binding protein